MIEGLDGLRVVGDAELFFRDTRVSCANELTGKNLGRLHRPKPVAIERAQTTAATVLFYRISHAMGQDDGVFAADDFVQGYELFGSDQRSGAIVNKDVGDVGRQRRERRGDRVLALGTSGDQQTRRGGERREREHLALVAVDDDIEIRDAACGERGCGVREDGPAGEESEHFVGDGPGHAGAAAGSEENGGGTGHF